MSGILPNRTPSSKPPRLGGGQFNGDKFVIDFLPPASGSTEAYFESPGEMITFPLGNPTIIMEAYDSDEIKPRSVTPETIGFVQKGSSVYARVAENESPIRMVTVEYDPGFRSVIQDSMSVRDFSLPTNNYQSTSARTKVLSQSIQQFMSNGFQGGKLVAESLVILCIVDAIELAGKVKERTKATKPILGQFQLRHTLDYIEANLSRNIGLNELASVAALSSYHFTRCFKNAIGTTPYAYLLNRRVERAKQLLIDGNISISNMAQNIGFSSQSHLTTVFKQHTGVTPSVFRAQAQR